MPTLEQVTDPLAGACTPVPHAGPGVCNICHNWPNPGFPRCYSCAQVLAQVSRPCELVVPTSLVTTRANQLYWELSRYKAAGVREELRRRFQRDLVGLLGRFLRDHHGCIAGLAGGGWDGVVVVPSSKDRTGLHPLVEAFSHYRPLRTAHRRVLGPGPAAIGWNTASDRGFEVLDDVEGERLLIVDDTYTTGARSQSAASALQLAGAAVIAIVPIGRVINLNPGYPHVHEAWKRQRQARFDFNVCCLE